MVKYCTEEHIVSMFLMYGDGENDAWSIRTHKILTLKWRQCHSKRVVGYHGCEDRQWEVQEGERATSRDHQEKNSK
jgi:hypothetical protein